MDRIRAEALALQLAGKRIGGWKIICLIDNGKSAAVFEAEQDGVAAALKIFDAELVERFGAEVQAARISREMELKGSQHPNLIEIYDGGWDEEHGVFYVVMEFVAQKNLAQQLEVVEPTSIPGLIRQLAAAARFLEDRGLVHRDIKPSNIVWDDSSKTLRLLDLGVLGPIGNVGCLTDHEGRQFIGTLQYSSPEYLLRQEEDNQADWRAITFYQIGAVMHDLIMRKPIFSEFANPFARLVNAVIVEKPLIKSSLVSPVVADLARACLLKNPQRRLSLVTWEKFENLEKPPAASVKERVTNRLMLSASVDDAPATVSEAAQRQALSMDLTSTLRRFVNTIKKDSSVFPPVTVVRDRENERLVLSFRPSERHQLPSGLNLIVTWDILETLENVVRLSGAIAAEQQPGPFKVFFEGVLDYPALYGAMEDLIYTLLDEAQSSPL